jgi:hypothetical protein
MNRRKFLNALTLGAVSAPVIALGAEKKPDSDFDKEGPICTETLVIQSGTKRKPKGEINHLMFDEYEEHKQVAMAVGRDGDLWIKSDQGKWKRVVTE